MAGADQIIFDVLDVGQGNGNFIRIFEGQNQDGSAKLVSSILIDLGAEGSKDWGKNSVDNIATELKKMNPATIDTIILSHSDKDHHNLIKNLLDHFDPKGNGKPKLVINYVKYGGYPSKYRKKPATNTLTLLKPFCTNGIPDLKGAPPFTTSFSAATYYPDRQICGNVNIYILAMNTPSSATIDDNHYLNTVSAVVIVDFNGYQFVLTGDATGTTMARCNNIIKDWGLTTNALNNVWMMAAPHHGSSLTAFDIQEVSEDDEKPKTEGFEIDNVKKFASNINARSITASAGRNAGFGHPSASFLSYFWATTKQTPPLFVDTNIKQVGSNGLHYYTAYYSGLEPLTLTNNYMNAGEIYKYPNHVSSHGWISMQTYYNIYTNDYCDKAGPGWQKTSKVWQTNTKKPKAEDESDSSSGEESSDDEEGSTPLPAALPNHTFILPPEELSFSATILTPALAAVPEHVNWHYTIPNPNTGAGALPVGLTYTPNQKKKKHSIFNQSSALRLPSPSHFRLHTPSLTVTPVGFKKIKVVA